MEKLTPLEKLELISPEAVDETPIEIIRSAMVQHLQEDATSSEEMHKLLKSIDDKLTPISETYTTVSRLGKWGMAALVALSLLSGIIYAVVATLKGR